MAEQVGISFGGDSAEARRHIERIIKELDKLSRHATVTSAAMSKALGGVSKEFGVMSGATNKNTKDLERNRTEVDRSTGSFSKFSRQIIVANQALSLMGKAIAILKFPAMIVAVGFAVQAINALAAGALALVGALGQLAGLAGAIPGAIITLGTAALTAKLAFAGLKEALDGNKEAFDKLTPEAKQFVRVLNGIKPIIKELRQSAQQGLFPGLTEGLNSIFNQRNVAVLRSGLQAMGKAMGETFAELGRLVGSSGFAADLDFLLKNAARNFRILGGAAVDIVDAFRNIAVAAQPLVNYLTSLISRFGEWIRGATEAGRRSGALARFFDQTKQTLQELGAILGPVGRALLNIFKIAAPYGHEILRLLGGAADQLQRVTESASGQSAIKKYFADAMPVLIEMGRLIRDVVGAFLKVGATPELTKLIHRLRTELLPILVGIMDSAMKGFAPALVDAAIALAKLVAVIAGASGPLTQFVQFLGAIFKFAGWIIQNVPGATKILAALFGIMAVNKVIPITKGISYLVRQYQLLAVAETEAGVASTVMSRMFAVSVKAMKAALVSTGIGIALIAIGLAAEYIMLHWDKVGPYFKYVFNLLAGAVEVFVGEALMSLGLLPKMMGTIVSVAAKAFGWIPGLGGKIKDAANQVADALSYVFDKGTQLAKDGGQRIYDGIKGGFDTQQKKNPLTLDLTAIATANQARTFGTVMGGAAGQVGLAGVTTPLSATRQTILRTAYEKGPASKRTYTFGTVTDCSGYVMEVYSSAGISLPHNAAAMWARNSSGTRGVVEEYNQALQPGDAVFFVGAGGSATKPGHVGLVVGPGDRFAEYYSTGKQARYNNVGARSDFIGSKRWLLPTEQTGGAPPETFAGGGGAAFVPTDPTFKSTGTSTKPTKRDVAAITADVNVFARGTKRVLDPRIRRELSQDITEVRKLLSGPVTRAEMDKAKKLFADMKALYEDGVNLNPIIKKLNFYDTHMGRFAGLPKTQAAIRQGVARTRALIKKFTQKRSEGGIQLTDEELKQIEDSYAKVGTAVKKGLERVKLQREFGEFKASLKNVVKDALKSLASPEVQETDIRARLSKLTAAAADAMHDGFNGRAKRLLARAREVRQELVQVLATRISEAKSKIASAWSSVMSGAFEAFDKQTQRMLDSAEKAVGAAFGVVRGQTGASRALAAFRQRREEANLAKAQAAANKELTDSEQNLQTVRSAAGATAEDITSAEQRVLAAKEALYEMGLDTQERALQAEADAQEIAYQEALEAARKQVTDQREVLREHLQLRFDMIQKAYDNEEITAAEAQEQILALLGEYGIETTEAMGATAIFTAALEDLGAAISHLAAVLRSVREMATPSQGSDYSPTQGNIVGPGNQKPAAVAVVTAAPIYGSGGRLFGAAQQGGIVGTGGTKIGRDHVLVGASPGEVILTQAQQANLMAGMGGGSPVIVQINRPLLLGRSLAVADEIAGAVAPAINRRIGYRY